MPNRLMTGAALAAALTTAVVAVAPSVATAAAGAPAAPGAVTAATTARSAAVSAAGDALRSEEQGRAGSVARTVGLGSAEGLTVRGVVVDPDGTRHVRYDRTLDGLRVVGGDLVVARSRAGAVTAQHRATSAKLAIASRTPRIGAVAAKALAASRAGYPVDSSTAALVVHAATGAPRLAWEVTTTGVRSTQTPSRLKTYVDARSGALLDRVEEVHEGTGNTQYSGAVPLNTITGVSGYRLRDSLNNYTTNLNRGTSGAGSEYTDADDIWGTGLPGEHPDRRGRRPVGGPGHLRLLPLRAQPRGHLEHRQGRPQPGPLRQRLRQRLLGRHPDDLRRRRGQRAAADPGRRRRPRDDPRRHPEHRGPALPR